MSQCNNKHWRHGDNGCMQRFSMPHTFSLQPTLFSYYVCIIELRASDCARVSQTPSIQLNPYAQVVKTLCHGRNNPGPTCRVNVIIGRSHLAVLENLYTSCAVHHVRGERACEATLHYVAAPGGPATHTQPMPDVNQCEITGDQQCSHGRR